MTMNHTTRRLLEMLADNYPDSRPALRWEICTRCDGHGTQSAGGYAYTATELAEAFDADSLADYAAGHYDTPCPTCNGRGSIQQLDASALDADAANAVDEWEAEEWASREEQRAEARMWAQ